MIAHLAADAAFVHPSFPARAANGAFTSPAALYAPLVAIRAEGAADIAPREALLDTAMGANRRRKSSEAIRRGRIAADGLSLVAVADESRVVGTVRLWHVAAGTRGGRDVPALLLGPLAVAPDLEGHGIGASLMRRAIAEADWRGHGAILLVGDPAYYERFGFSDAGTRDLAMPGPFERHRFLALELSRGRLAGATGLIRGTGALETGLAA